MCCQRAVAFSVSCLSFLVNVGVPARMGVSIIIVIVISGQYGSLSLKLKLSNRVCWLSNSVTYVSLL